MATESKPSQKVPGSRRATAKQSAAKKATRTKTPAAKRSGTAKKGGVPQPARPRTRAATTARAGGRATATRRSPAQKATGFASGRERPAGWLADLAAERLGSAGGRLAQRPPKPPLAHDPVAAPEFEPETAWEVPATPEPPATTSEELPVEDWETVPVEGLTPPPPAVPSPAPHPTPAPAWSPATATPPARTDEDGQRSKKAVVGAVVVVLALVGASVLAFTLVRGGSPSKEEFVADADAICRPANGPVTAIVRPTSFTELGEAAGTLATTTNGQLGQLRALDTPGGDAGKGARDVLTGLEATSRSAQRLQDVAAKSDNVQTIAATKDLDASYRDTQTKAQTYGFTACARGMAPGVESVFKGSQSVLKAQFAAEADGVCRSAARKFEDLPEVDFSDGQDVARDVGASREIFATMVDELRALPVPPGDEETVTEMLDDQGKAVDKMGDMEDAASDEDPERFEVASRQLSPLITAADAKFDAYGLETCGSSFGSE